MYCINFRRSSIGIDYDRKSSGQSDIYKKVTSDLNKCGLNIGNRNKNIPINTCRKDRNRQSYKLTEEKKYEFNQHRTNHVPEKTRKFIPSKNEKRRQESDKPNSLKLLSRSLPKPNFSTTKEAGFQKYRENRKYEGARRRQRSERVKEKKDEILDFATFESLTKNEQDDQSTWVRPFLSCGDIHEQSISPDPLYQNKRKDDIISSNEIQLSSMALSDQRLRNELKRSRRMLEAERHKNRALRYKLDNMEYRLKAIDASHSTEGCFGQIQKLEEEAAFYRREFQGEKKKREDFEDTLQQNRQEKQSYAEQMDVLIFEYIPNVAPKFKDIGPVNYVIEESFDYVGLYQLGDILGEGYYGSVRIGSHTRSHKRFAVKILNKENINRFKDLKQIAEEIHVLKTYRHPNIIHLEEVVHATDCIYVVTELCFMDLHKYHSEIGLTIESARQVVYGILHPLYHLHVHGICHLDLKPENILLTKSLDAHNASHKHVRICDFGLVSMVRKSSQNKDVIREGYACGTPGFYAPEMIVREKFEGRTADMVSTRIRSQGFQTFWFTIFFLLSLTSIIFFISFKPTT